MQLIIIMEAAYLIVDYNNIFPIGKDTKEVVEYALSYVIQQTLDEYESIDTVIVKIYAGFYRNDCLTIRASQIMQQITSINVIPDRYNGRIIRGDVEFGTKLYGVDFEWKNTYREKDGPRIVVNLDLHRPQCENYKQSCPIEILKKFTKGANKICPNEDCNLRNVDIFKQYGQKMVDTLMTCDILTLAEESNTKLISIMSDDVDLYPAIVLSRCKYPNVQLKLYSRNNRRINEISELNDKFKITSFLLP